MFFAFSACDLETMRQQRELEEHRVAAKTALEVYAENRGEENFTPENWAVIQGHVDYGKAAIKASADKGTIDSALAKAKENIGAVKTNEEIALLEAYKADAKSALESHAEDKGQENYYTDDWDEILRLVANGKAEISAADTKSVVDSVLEAAKQTVSAVFTQQQRRLDDFKIRINAELESFVNNVARQENYTPENWSRILDYLASGKAAINLAVDIFGVDVASAAARWSIGMVPRIGNRGVTLSIETLKPIKQAAGPFIVFGIFPFHFQLPCIENTAFFYYGTFNGNVVVMFHHRNAGGNRARGEDIFGIRYSSSNQFILVWSNNNFYRLSEAYGQGMLATEDLEEIARIHADEGNRVYGWRIGYWV